MLNIYICIEKIKVLLLYGILQHSVLFQGGQLFIVVFSFSGYSVLVKTEAMLKVFIGGKGYALEEALLGVVIFVKMQKLDFCLLLRG